MNAGLMQFLQQMGPLLAARQQGGPEFDKFGIQMPEAQPSVAPPPSPQIPPVGQHIGDVMGQQPMQSPNTLEMIMRLFGQGTR